MENNKKKQTLEIDPKIKALFNKGLGYVNLKEY